MKPKASSVWAARGIHVARLALLAALVLGLHQLAARGTSSTLAPTLDLSVVQSALPATAQLERVPGEAALWRVLDKDGRQLALAATTSPKGDVISGYAGPNNVLLLMDDQQQVTAARLIASHDTLDHVNRVRHSDAFWEEFVGWQVGQPPPGPLDGVSGATLTSLAIAEAVALRLGGERPSLRFPEEVALDEVQALVDGATSLRPDPQRRGVSQVLDAAGKPIASILRTGPLVDSVVGYQGPAELLLVLDDRDIVTKIRLRRSFDNDQYVRYTRQEASFWAKFVGRSLDDLSRIDLAAEEIEGVSGATMTSMAVAETIRQAAQRHLDAQAKPQQPDQLPQRAWNWSIGETSTALVALLVLPWSLSRFRGQRTLRWLWQILCLIAIVGLSGNLLSLALLGGWTRTGVPMRLAPGLASLVIVALAAPAVLGRNVYCDHVCPHGIAQQWLARGLRGRRLGRTVQARSSARRKLDWILQLSAVAVIGLALAWVVWRRPAQISWLEPFDTYAWRVGLSASLIVWLASLLLAARQPMGYCRLACPTGKVLETARLKRASSRVVTSDMLLVLLTAAVWIAIGISNGESMR